MTTQNVQAYIPPERKLQITHKVEFTTKLDQTKSLAYAAITEHDNCKPEAQLKYSFRFVKVHFVWNTVCFS